MGGGGGPRRGRPGVQISFLNSSEDVASEQRSSLLLCYCKNGRQSQNHSPIPVGMRGVFYSFKLFLSSIAALTGRGGGQHLVIPSAKLCTTVHVAKTTERLFPFLLLFGASFRTDKKTLRKKCLVLFVTQT
jgi:hypothetical protein